MKKRSLKDQYRKEYWEGVRNGTIRRGVKFKTIVTSGPGEPLTYAVVYEDEPGYAEAEFKIPTTHKDQPLMEKKDEPIMFSLSFDDAKYLLATLEWAQEVSCDTADGNGPIYDPISALIYSLKNRLDGKHSIRVV